MIAVAVAGAAGTMGRWALSSWAKGLWGESFPYGTLLVNVLGCLLAGAAMEIVLRTEVVPAALRIPITVGFLGAFTTFSTFGAETMRFMQTGAWVPAMTNVGANLVLGLGATWLGFAAARAALQAS